MRKLPEHLECPVDNWIYIAVEYIEPYFYRGGWTPNRITTLSNVFGLLAAYCIYKRKFVIAAAAFVLAYVFDCLDGYVARKHNMVTVFGDYYDHYSDIVKYALVFYFLWRVDSTLFVMVVLIYVCLAILKGMHIGYQELYYRLESDCEECETESNFLWGLTHLCDLEDPNDKEEIMDKMRYTRHFGCGTSILYITVVILGYGALYGK